MVGVGSNKQAFFYPFPAFWVIVMAIFQSFPANLIVFPLVAGSHPPGFIFVRKGVYMCTLSLNAKRVLVKLTVGMTTGCHFDIENDTKKSAFAAMGVQETHERYLSSIFITICSSSRDNVIDEHLVFVLLKCVLSLNYISPSYCLC